MSDDGLPDDGLADSDTGATDDVLVGAGVSAGSARAAARASARSGVTPGKGRATRSRNQQDKRPNIFMRIIHYLREVFGELRKVIWPTKNEMVTYSIVVILFLVFMITMIWALDIGFARLMLSIFG